MLFLADDPPSSSARPYTGSRPGTAGSRPGTAGRRLTSGATTSQLGPDLAHANTNAAIIHRELGNDELLRIMNRNGIQTQNDLFVLAELGDYAKFKRLADDLRVDLTQFRGLHGYGLLHHASSRGHGSIVAELIRNNRDSVNMRNDQQETALHLAAYAGHLLIVDQLLDSGAQIDAQTADLETSLFYAARKRHAAVIRLLMQRGADAELEDRYGEKAADHALDPLAQKAFTEHLGDALTPPGDGPTAPLKLQHQDLLVIYAYLSTNDLLRAACVSRKWHMVSGYESLWKSRGLRRWELALQSSLGFAPTTMSFFRRPSARSLATSTGSSSSLASGSNGGGGGNGSSSRRLAGGSSWREDGASRSRPGSSS